MIKPEFLDIINYSLCRAVYDCLKEETNDFFRKVGEYHFEEAQKRRIFTIESNNKPLDILIKIARYLESSGYMKKISVNKLSETEAIVEMYGVSVTPSSARLLQEGKVPSHFMTNMMFAALKSRGVQAQLQDLEYNENTAYFKERWKIR